MQHAQGLIVIFIIYLFDPPIGCYCNHYFILNYYMILSILFFRNIVTNVLILDFVKTLTSVNHRKFLFKPNQYELTEQMLC